MFALQTPSLLDVLKGYRIQFKQEVVISLANMQKIKRSYPKQTNQLFANEIIIINCLKNSHF